MRADSNDPAWRASMARILADHERAEPVELFPRREVSNPLEPGLPVPVVGTEDTVFLVPVVTGAPVGVTLRPGLIVDADRKE